MRNEKQPTVNFRLMFLLYCYLTTNLKLNAYTIIPTIHAIENVICTGLPVNLLIKLESKIQLNKSIKNGSIIKEINHLDVFLLIGKVERNKPN